MGQVHAAAKPLRETLSHAREIGDGDGIGANFRYDLSVTARVDTGGIATGGVEDNEADRHQDCKSNNDDAAGSFEAT